MFFGGSASGLAMAVGVSDEVLAYRATIQQVAQKYGMEAYVELLMAVMMQESGGRGSDPMQAAEGGFNKKYPHVPNGITDPAYSIECGIQELKYALDKAGCTGPTDLDRIKLALQGYNYGSGYIDWAMERDGGYTKENAIAYSDMMCARRTGIMTGMGTRNMWSMFSGIIRLPIPAEAIRQTECRFRTISRPITGTFLMAAAPSHLPAAGLPALP